MTTYRIDPSHCASCARDHKREEVMTEIPASVWWPIVSQLKSQGWAERGVQSRDAVFCEKPAILAIYAA